MGRDHFDLDGRVALVTGASRGIGAAIARLLAAYGAHVVVSSRHADACETAADAIRADGGSAEGFACHIGELDQIEQVLQHIDARHGRLDILVNNAAANPYYGHILDTDLRAFEKTVDVNLRGCFFMSRGAGQRMREQGRGAIVNVASVNGFSPGDKQGIYSVTKAAIVNMTRAFARECAAHNIRVNCLVPGLTETKFAAALHGDPQVRDQWERSIPMRRIGQPAEMAGAVLYLVSDAASFTTGTCLVVDGGMLA